jgi:hypothetical protein
MTQNLNRDPEIARQRIVVFKRSKGINRDLHHHSYLHPRTRTSSQNLRLAFLHPQTSRGHPQNLSLGSP